MILVGKGKLGLQIAAITECSAEGPNQIRTCSSLEPPLTQTQVEPSRVAEAGKSSREQLGEGGRGGEGVFES